MRLTEHQLRRIIRQTIIEENKRQLDESVMQNIKKLSGVALMTTLAAFSACTNAPLAPQDVAKPAEAVSVVAQKVKKTPEVPFNKFVKLQQKNIDRLRAEGRDQDANDLQKLLDGLKQVHDVNFKLSGVNDEGERVQTGLRQPGEN